MKKYYRIMLGQQSADATTCRNGGFLGADFGIDQDLTNQLPEDRKDFRRVFVPIMREMFPNKTKIGVGLSCGSLYTIAKGLRHGDTVLCPDGAGSYHVGEVVGNYSYQPGEILPHRRTIIWNDELVERADMSTALKNSTGSMGTVAEISQFADEIESLVSGKNSPIGPVDDSTVFVLEKHLEDFLVQNWCQTELGKRYDLVEVDGKVVGQQYPTDTGPIDILAVSKDGKELLVVELKKGKASDKVVGQVQRYMGCVLEDLAEPGQDVRGVIIALEDDLRIRRALSVTRNIDFYRYEVSFDLFKA